ncbi:Ger(x)C family spore germination protein [Desulfosporosinus meridiei]|uniref:Germination protein, Ger(X)C family n=1 Tax=Desulfosporosinus meridiei (strain ATCC BAA-275 / DSM 13257 / KCTC 12902 / NCIMB 13706 / S10) TaxID=768704 RepID=J7IYX1_DESMD|nr:Ger(x)C family spore germination protein [Desulfosporosinus meridiei]AFQ43891.1 germination protein, Ger(X)C family [Desulfosporosinus meridiei DSM 13257]
MTHIKRVVLLMIIINIVFLSGCSSFFVENNTVEEIAPVIFWSIQEGESGKLKISTLLPPLINEKKSMLTLQVNLLKQGRKDFNLVYYRELKLGQLRMLFISEELAKKGILPLIDTLLTDPDISQRLYLVVIKGNFDDYIRNQVDKQENLDYFLYRMLKHYETKNQGDITVINLHQFLKRLYSPFSDPILPVFKVNKENFIYNGTAFFKDDKLVATISDMNDQILQLLNNDYYLKLLPIPSLAVSLGQIRSKVIIKLAPDYSSISIKVNLVGRIEEYRGDKNIVDSDELEDLNQEIKSYLEKQTTALLQKMQQWKVDPLQVGTHSLTPFSQPIKDEEWLRKWGNMELQINYQLDLQTMTNVNK